MIRSRVLLSWKVATLSERALLHVEGRDTIKFLQGLVTNDINKLITTPLLYTALLKPDGRLLHDLFIYSNLDIDTDQNGNTSFWIEHPQSSTATLRSYLQRHVLRSKVKIAKLASEERVVQVAWNSIPSRDDPSAESYLKEVIGATPDPRHPELGYRWNSIPSPLRTSPPPASPTQPPSE